jgi:hypothetical protein
VTRPELPLFKLPGDQHVAGHDRGTRGSDAIPPDPSAIFAAIESDARFNWRFNWSTRKPYPRENGSVVEHTSSGKSMDFW